MAKIAGTAKEQIFSKNVNNAMSLVHSALDLSKEIHEFATWISDDRFTQTPQNSGKVLNAPFI